MNRNEMTTSTEVKNSLDTLTKKLKTINDFRCTFPEDVKVKTDWHKALFGSHVKKYEYDRSGNNISITEDGRVKSRTVVRGKKSNVYEYNNFGNCISSKVVDTGSLRRCLGFLHDFQKLDVAKEVLDCLFILRYEQSSDNSIVFNEEKSTITRYTESGMVEYFVDTFDTEYSIMISKIIYDIDGLERSRIIATYRDGILVECESPINRLTFATRRNMHRNMYTYYKGGKLSGTIKCDNNKRPLEIASYIGNTRHHVTRFEYWQ